MNEGSNARASEPSQSIPESWLRRSCPPSQSAAGEPGSVLVSPRA